MGRRHHREEGEKSARATGLIGERSEKVSGYENPMWKCVDKMVEGDYPTTNLATVAAASRHAGGSSHHMVDKKMESTPMKKGGHAHHHKKHFAAGGIGKVRKDMY